MHPYYPPDAVISDYAPNEWGTLPLVSIFAGVCALIFLTTYAGCLRMRPHIPTTELWTVLWFVLCGAIHLLLEGYYATTFHNIASKQTLLAQLWKEYSMSDSRYLTQDAFVLCMETITAVCWGPLSLVVALFIALDHPLRHPLQLVVSLGQLYGDVLYYATCFFQHQVYHLSYSRPEAFYFWGYFVFLNAFWIVLPSVLIINSIKACGKAFAVVQGMKHGGGETITGVGKRKTKSN
ncbi:EBDP4, emopamil-binding protein [Aspergillus sclerotiicarbonarius CBS 121057]|uniref:EBDP4, emopamil-binding protein n=1 Tax=Aspergillus sclerotiicarbonarius (strain CBS 121057 / IBT 28362) TaxID=1448318 RepID=A0A319E0D3_ASPSB|nr:EBDP4, emopamil-binding protein [Aspergillus sclerotiicarbonarius CBS 121057]